VCAELRGWRAPDGSQPFWNAVGRHFFEMEFEQADAYNAANGNQFIEDLMPRYPIYAALLPQSARDCLGKPHDSALPAMKMLLDEGFQFNDYIDVFDGGPLVDAKADRIRTIRESRLLRVAAVEKITNGTDALLATGAVNSFRCAKTVVKVEADAITIDPKAARALQADIGSTVRYADWR
jgi:arginine N-succinyltransferase